MVYRTGYLLSISGFEKYIQIESILAYYEQQYISTGKHLLYEDETFIGNVTILDGHYVFNVSNDFSTKAKSEIANYLKTLVIPHQPELTSAFGFGLQQSKELTFCEVILKAGQYEVWFNGSFAALLSQNDKCIWLQVSGKTLLPSILREIISRIESHYNQL